MATKSKTKIYYWLKFDKYFFDNLFIKRLLRDFPGGPEMIVIYIRLMLEAIDNDCIIDYEGTFDNYAEELALRLGVSEEQINMALAYFTKCGVIQVDSDGNTHFPQAKALLGQETNWNRYKKKQAELEKFQPHSNFLPTDIDIEKDIEKDIKIDIESEVDIVKPATEKNIFDYYQSRIGALDGYQVEKLQGYLSISLQARLHFWMSVLKSKQKIHSWQPLSSRKRMNHRFILAYIHCMFWKWRRFNW